SLCPDQQAGIMLLYATIVQKMREGCQPHKNHDWQPPIRPGRCAPRPYFSRSLLLTQGLVHVNISVESDMSPCIPERSLKWKSCLACSSHLSGPCSALPASFSCAIPSLRCCRNACWA